MSKFKSLSFRSVMKNSPVLFFFKFIKETFHTSGVSLYSNIYFQISSFLQLTRFWLNCGMVSLINWALIVASQFFYIFLVFLLFSTANFQIATIPFSLKLPLIRFSLHLALYPLLYGEDKGCQIVILSSFCCHTNKSG